VRGREGIVCVYIVCMCAVYGSEGIVCVCVCIVCMHAVYL
jgi:hypothetical protein